jgi:hypothetical protein
MFLVPAVEAREEGTNPPPGRLNKDFIERITWIRIKIL